MANVTIPGGDFKRFAQFARRCLVSVGVGHANRAKGNAWELPKKFEGRVPLFLNRLMGLPVDQQKLVRLFLSFPYWQIRQTDEECSMFTAVCVFHGDARG